MAREAIDLTVSGAPAHDDLAALRAKLWYPDVDGVLFDEAVRCFEQTVYRAALVMTWLAIAEGLRHRFEVAAQRDLIRSASAASRNAAPSPSKVGPETVTKPSLDSSAR
jgi:hypothetical protein